MGHDDGTADIASEGKRDKDECDIVAVADGGECILADEPAGDEAVRDIVELLEEDAAKHRQAELPEDSLRISDGKVFVQGFVRIFVHMRNHSFLNIADRILQISLFIL